MDSDKYIKWFIYSSIVLLIAAFTTACTVQWAFKNKNTECGLIKDGRDPHRYQKEGPTSFTLYDNREKEKR